MPLTAPSKPIEVQPDDAWRSLAAPPEFAQVKGGGAPRIAEEAAPTCPVCSGAEFTPLAVGFDYESRTCSNPWRFVTCRACSHVWLNPRPAISTLSAIYPPTYYAYHYDTEVNALARRGKEFLDARKFAGILTTLGRPAKSFVDIGCGDGRFLKLMRSRGVPDSTNYGLELDDKVCARLRADGFSAICKRVEDCDDIPAGSLDLATMFHVIEHVDDPAAVTRRIASWLAPGGVFAVETPNIDSLDARLFRNTYWGGYHIPRHWNMFTPRSLSRLLEAAGLEVVATRYQTGHSFWMWSMHHVTRYHGASRPRLAHALFNPFKGLPALLAFTAFDKLRAAVGCKTSSMLMLARKEP